MVAPGTYSVQNVCQFDADLSFGRVPRLPQRYRLVILHPFRVRGSPVACVAYIHHLVSAAHVKHSHENCSLVPYTAIICSYALLRQRLHQFLENSRCQQRPIRVRLHERLSPPQRGDCIGRQPSFHVKAIWYTMGAADMHVVMKTVKGESGVVGPSLTVACVTLSRARASLYNPCISRVVPFHWCSSDCLVGAQTLGKGRWSETWRPNSGWCAPCLFSGITARAGRTAH